VSPVLLNQTFTDSNGYLWNFTDADLGTGKITLKSVNGVIRTRTNQASGGTEVSVEYLYQFIVDKSLSKSGFFLFSGNSNNDEEDKFWDEEWAMIDLDADGNYNCGNFGEGDSWSCEEYVLLLADRQTSGVYDTLLISPTRNMTQGVNSYDGFPGASRDISLTVVQRHLSPQHDI
jgi:hypothetical protein